MKRFLSIILTAAMLMSATPAVFAENNAVDKSVIVAEELTPENQEEITEEVTENVTEDVSEKISGEGEENSEEQISLMSGENDISLLANETDEVQYSTDTGSTWTSSSLSDAVTAIGTGTGTIKVQNDVTVSAEIKITGNVTLIADGKDVTIKRANTLTDAPVISVASGATLNLGTETAMENTLTIDGGAVWNGNNGHPLLNNNAVLNNTGILSNSPLIISNGELTMFDRVVLQNNFNSDRTRGGSVMNSGTFNMKGGKITDNYGSFGGGVTVGGDSDSATMNFIDGEIVYNAAVLGGAIFLGHIQGKTDRDQKGHYLNMSGGKIANNSTGENALHTGTVCIMYNSGFNMTGGEITNNNSVFGGGIGNFGSLVVDGGYIHGNTASGSSSGYSLGGDDIWNYGNETGTYSGNVMTLPQNITLGSDEYSIDWYYDGCKDGDVYSRYSTTKTEKSCVKADYEQCSLKAVYTKLEKYTLTLTCPEAKRDYIKVYVDGDEAKGNTIDVTNQSTVKLVADQTAYDNGFYIWKVGSRSYSYNATNPEKNAGVENYGTVTLTNISKDTTVEAIFRYTVTITANPETAGTVLFKKYDFSSNGYVEDTEAGNKKVFQSKSDVDFYQQPKDGYTFVEWKIYDSDTKEEIKNISVNDYVSSYGVYEIKAPERDITIEAVYQKIPTYTVTVTDPSYMMGSLGTIKVSGADDLTAVPAETELTLSIADENVAIKANHSFVKWVVKTESGTDVTVIDNKFTMPGEAVTVTAEYVPNIKMVFYAGGTYVSTTNECKDYTWNDDGTITYTMPGNKGTLTISTPDGFKLWQYIVDDGTKTPTVTANDVVTVTVNTNEGYMFNGIKSVTDQYEKLTGTFNNSGTYTFSVPVGTYESYKGEQTAFIILDIAKNQYNITKNFNSNEGSVKVVYSSDTSTEISKAYHGSTIWVGVEPNANYKVKSVKVTDKNNAEVTLDTTYVAKYNTWAFTMPTSDVTVSVEFELDACAITTDIKNGTISGITSTAVIGSDVSFTLAPKDDTYKLDSYKVFKTGDEATTVDVTESNGTYTFTMPDYAVTVSAVFVKKTHSITTSCTPTEGGTITVQGGSSVTVGDKVYINVAASAHYEIDTVTVNGATAAVDEHGDYTFTMPNSDVTINATFKKKQYSVTANGNNVTFGGLNSKYTWGDAVEFTVTSYKWYNIKSVYANDETVSITPVAGKENTYSFTMPQGDVVITAVTERPNFTVTFDSKGGSNITPKTVANGDSADKPDAPVWAVRGFAGWYLDENYTQKYDFTTPVTENITLYARWFLWGDVNNDGTVDSYDALLIRRCRAGLTDYSLIENRLAGFVNGFENGRNYPDSGDAVSIRRFRAGLINRYKVEDSAAGYEFDLENDTYIPKN